VGYCSITGIMRSQDFYMRRQEQNAPSPHLKHTYRKERAAQEYTMRCEV
jgi:hypothetical protein